jgi:hypothetical protein
VSPKLLKSGRQKGGQALSESVNDRMCHVLRAGTQMEDGQHRASGDRWPATARGSVWRFAACCAVHPGGDAGAGDGKRRVGARSGHVDQREPEKLAMVACREPCDPLGRRRVQPFGQREIGTRALWCEGAFRRDRGVWRLEVNVGWQPRPRTVWMRSVRPCLPSPTRRVEVSVCDPAGRALQMRTSQAVGVHALGCPSAAFPLTPGPRLPQGQVSHMGSRGDRWDKQAACVA